MVTPGRITGIKFESDESGMARNIGANCLHTLAVNVTVESASYLIMIANNCLMPSPLSTKSIKPIDIELDGRKSPRRGSHGHQSSIVEDHSYTLSIGYRGVDVNTASYSRTLELQVACQVQGVCLAIWP